MIYHGLEANLERAEWAEEAMQRFRALTGQDPEADGREEILSDLLADMLHLARFHGIDPYAVIERGERHYSYELDEELMEFEEEAAS
jgi:hypothetical protein